MSINNNVDRLSLLPDSLLHCILSFLNTKEVVQTCVLSKRWKPIWTNIPTLNFDFNSYPFQLEPSSSSTNPGSKEMSFKNFIFSFLPRHCAGIVQKLRYISSSIYEDSILVEFLICYSRFHLVQELHIDSIDNYFDWKRSLFEFHCLIVLKISCHYVYDWGLLIVPSLTTLEIESGCKVWNEDENNSKNMFVGCPNLKSLVLVNCLDNSARICGPKLENLELCTSSYFPLDSLELELFTPNLKFVKLKHMLPIVKGDLVFSYLEKVNLAIADCYFKPEHLNEFEGLAEDLLKLIQVFHNARSLTIPLQAIEVVMSSVPAVLLFQNLKHLNLKTKENSKKIELPIGLLTYLQNCPALQTLLVDLNED